MSNCLHCNRPLPIYRGEKTNKRKYCNVVCRNLHYATTRKYITKIPGIGSDGCAPLQPIKEKK